MVLLCECTDKDEIKFELRNKQHIIKSKTLKKLNRTYTTTRNRVAIRESDRRVSSYNIRCETTNMMSNTDI